MIRRDFFRLITAAAAMAVLPFKAIAAPTWRMVLYKGDTVIAECNGPVQSRSDTFDGEFTFDKAATVEGVSLQHKARKTTAHCVTFPTINVGPGDVLQMQYKVVP
jgi:hypothetical protein